MDEGDEVTEEGEGEDHSPNDELGVPPVPDIDEPLQERAARRGDGGLGGGAGLGGGRREGEGAEDHQAAQTRQEDQTRQELKHKVSPCHHHNHHHHHHHRHDHVLKAG